MDAAGGSRARPGGARAGGRARAGGAEGGRPAQRRARDALRGIALAQLGEYPRARALLRRAARAFGARAPLDRARCLVAEAEVTLAMRDLRGRPAPLDALAGRLGRMGDAANARQARLVAARWSLLIGRLADARAALARRRPGGRLADAAGPLRAGTRRDRDARDPRARRGRGRSIARAYGGRVVGRRRADRRDRAGQSRAGPTLRAAGPARHLDGRRAGGRRRDAGVERPGGGRDPPDGAGSVAPARGCPGGRYCSRWCGRWPRRGPTRRRARA